MKRWFLVALVAGVLLAWAARPWLERCRAWNKHQREYNRRQAAAGRPLIEVGLRAIAEERCVSCHLGMVYPDEHAPPFQRHPQLSCTVAVRRVGCTVCHGGDSQRLTVESAHGLTKGSRQPLRDWRAGRARRALLEPGCAHCHGRREHGRLAYDEDKVPEVARGLELFLAQGCYTCHHVNGVYSARESGPALSDVGLRRPREELRGWLDKPQEHSASSPMPPVRLAPAELQALLSFLEAQRGGLAQTPAPSPRLVEHFPGDYPSRPNVTAGALWSRRLGCPGCHSLAEGELGVPDLRRIGWVTSDEEIRQMLLQPDRRVQGTFMPRLALPEEVMESLVLYLATMRAPLPSAARQVMTDVCYQCHGRTPDSKVVVLAKRPPILEGKAPPLARERFAAAVQNGRPGTAMRAWGRVFSASFVELLYASLVGR